MSGRLPVWFKQKLPDPQVMQEMARLMEHSHLHTICESAQCPNSGDCFSTHTATFLILGDMCTRRCTFCAVKKGSPEPVDAGEPQRLLDAAIVLGLRHAVITSVTRDDLPDGGASQFARVVEMLHGNCDYIATEVLVPDFRGSLRALGTVVLSQPEVINHNVETVHRLYPDVRPSADYSRSLEVISHVKRLDSRTITKSGMMVGLGETTEEVLGVMKDLRESGCDLLTIGQYLQPSPAHHPVARFVTPQEFSEYEVAGREMGFAGVASAPLVRSSFQAARMYADAEPRCARSGPVGNSR
ncbi:MAG: lipoyl synthase [Chloroflexi bacterium RBG_16_57_8]|nr:MAG: lipoyl synthase [Chloroflexi bacterium RBG_16_57_8]